MADELELPSADGSPGPISADIPEVIDLSEDEQFKAATSSAPGRVPPTSWWEDPHFNLERLTPGQRYTLVLTVILIVILLKFGLPHVAPSALIGPIRSIGAAGGAVGSHLGARA